MQRRDLQQIKEEVRARVDIVEIIGGYTRLKPAGKKFTGLCPFHADKNPSFSVSVLFQSYKCWSCGEKGDVFTFLQKKENLTFVEALERLAQRVGIPFEHGGFSPERASEREEMHELNSIALDYFRDRLSRSDDARAYVAGRGILKETRDRFDIGYAPPDWDGLASTLQRRRANLTLAARIGLVREKKETQGYIDYFRNRVMFPIHDRTGSVAGFGGRAMGDDTPKYLNSPQSEIFNKSGLLYGLYFARQKLSADVPPVFVEGYTDVVTAHQAGFVQCVATLGTAMTEVHARMLVNYNRRVILCYDSDSAGINATLKGAAIWDDMGVDGSTLLVARLPPGDDPDSLLKRGDVSTFQLALDAAVPRVDFEIELALSRNNPASSEGCSRALAEIVPILATVRGSSSLDAYVQKVARLHPMFGFNPNRAMESIISDVGAYRRRNKSSSRSRGHATVELQNGAPLREQAPPPSYNPEPRQTGFYSQTRKWIRTGGARDSYGGRIDVPTAPSDPTPPSLGLPALTSAEKAEYTLLRALFSSDWRSFVQSRLGNTSFISPQAQELASWILKVTPDQDGDINPLGVLSLIEQDLVTDEQFESDLDEAPDSLPFRQSDSITGNNSTSLSDYLRDVVEESETVLSNEPLNEATITGCFRKLAEHQTSLVIREVKAELAREDLTAQQRADFMHRLMELTRARRGSAPGSQ